MSKLTPFFFAIFEDRDLDNYRFRNKGTIPWAFYGFYPYRRKNHVCDNVTNLKQKSKRKRLCSIIFQKTTTVYEDLKKLHAKTGHGSFFKIKNHNHGRQKVATREFKNKWHMIKHKCQRKCSVC